ncbi:hypothetical protein DOY81_010604 [Sarcophaga bullata]|nr:hypothetical protein DOY81_010604 [Sarcophaga bullata]
MANTKTKLTPVHKPATSYDVPFKYEIPSLQTQSYSDNHLRPEETYLAPSSSPKPQVYHQQKNNYKVVEDSTNDQTVLDPVSGSQKLIAPDPDPSLPAAPVRPATEPFNTPSNGKPLPVDIQSNHLTLAQPLVQIVGAQASQQIAPQIYPVQYTQPIAAAPVPIYNPTYLVQQSNNLYTQHKQQLFKPALAALPIVEAGYVNADLTQEVASNGQILQAAKDPHNNIHPVLDIAPHFAPLIAAPSLDEEHQAIETAPFHLQNIGGPPSAISSTTEAGFVQQLGADTPLRIFVPDEEEARLQKRSDNVVKGSFEDVENTEGVEDQQPEDELYEVSSSVEVSNEDQQQQQHRQQTFISSGNNKLHHQMKNE